MYDNRLPSESELPSPAQLLRSTLAALVVAAGLLVTVILPAESAIDPTGIGRFLGLTQMGEIKIALALEADAAPHADLGEPTHAPASAAAPEAAPAEEAREVTLSLAPDEAAEIKVDMLQGQTIAFEWETDGPRVNFDLHGDAPSIDYHRYTRGSDVRVAGELEAAFDGAHGWFWRNRSGQTVNIVLRVRGEFTDVRRVM
ncbi:MAG: transmembrane anchor protein [Hyphomonadaceae bacterium]|nr:transmembrane anchor protein [Hyphomonadaceae bacterium]